MESAKLLTLEANLKNDASALSSRKLEIESRRSALEKLSRERNGESLNLERERARYNEKLALFESEEAQITARLWDTYEMTRSEALNNSFPIDNEQTAKRRVEHLKREMSLLGTPNLGAIEEYERVRERHDYLSMQLADLDTAANELRNIIADITHEMQALFVSGFKDISDSFTMVFEELFGGGEADLYLEEPDNPLESGIGISVQPPGKQLRRLTLLSGGERAFVAIALYFAILRVHPAPFVILDEIEAALDDANVIRFAAYLRRMSATTQMIAVTHRRGTMEEADTLIGVTMAERGVSKLITLSLEEAEIVAQAK